ncbi:hypothetical protein [Photobacterium sanguinicancri]|uniref:hypothetical protein n=1 Tax=Photobacterium sanguinicancri TaxID=875932 RepID=UPI002480F49F|nr:hypothetical protein [Photobacterium sanguinicancri]
MQDRNKDQLMEAMDFIVDAVAQSTAGKSKAVIGFYLANLVIADHMKELSPNKKEGLKQLLERADEISEMG